MKEELWAVKIIELNDKIINLFKEKELLEKDVESLLEVIDKNNLMTLWQHIKYWWNNRRLKKINEKFMRENNR